MLTRFRGASVIKTTRPKYQNRVIHSHVPQRIGLYAQNILKYKSMCKVCPLYELLGQSRLNLTATQCSLGYKTLINNMYSKAETADVFTSCSEWRKCHIFAVTSSVFAAQCNIYSILTFGSLVHGILGNIHIMPACPFSEMQENLFFCAGQQLIASKISLLYFYNYFVYINI